MSRHISPTIAIAMGIAIAFIASAGLHLVINVVTAASQGRELSLADLFAGTIPASLPMVLCLLAGAVVIELAVVGWRRSSLRKISVGEVAASRHDVVFAAMAILGVQSSIAIALSGGFTTTALATLDTAAARGPLQDAPIWLAAPALYLGATFTNYWGHRLMHTRLLWPLHAIHHAAPEFTLLTGARVSLLEDFTIVLTQAIAFAALGGSTEALYWAGFVLGLETLWTHNNIRGIEWLERLGINTPKAHTIHHARDSRYHHRNFGDGICLWDKLFGTYMASSTIGGELELGIDDPTGLYQSGRPLRDLFAPQWAWLVGVVGAIAMRLPLKRMAAARAN